MRLNFVKAIVVLWTLSIAVASAQQPLDLELNLDTGDSYRCEMHMNRKITQTIDGKAQGLDQEMLMVWSYDVLSEEGDGDYNLRLTYERIKISQDFGFQKFEYDSDDPPAYVEPAMKGYSALVRAELDVRMDRKGRVVELSGAQDLLDRVVNNLDMPDSPYKEKMLSDIRAQFGEEALRSAIQQITIFYPPEAVAINDSWETIEEINTGFPMKVDSRYKLVQRLEGIARIEVRADISSDPDSQFVELGGLNVSYDITGDQDGVIEVDEESGLPVKSEIGMGFEGTVSAMGLADQPSRSWPIKATGTVLITFDER